MSNFEQTVAQLSAGCQRLAARS